MANKLELRTAVEETTQLASESEVDKIFSSQIINSMRYE